MLPLQGKYTQRKLGSCLTDALKLVLLIGLLVMAFGPSHSYSLIRILYGQKWSDGEASTALKYYALYVVVLAMNGTSEAFLHAVATEKSLRCWNDSLLVFSLMYLVLNVCLIQSVGAVGLILANSLSILSSNLVISGFFIFLLKLLAFRVVCFGVFMCSYSHFRESILDHDNFWATFCVHFSVGFACLIIAAIVI